MRRHPPPRGFTKQGRREQRKVRADIALARADHKGDLRVGAGGAL